MTDTSSLIQQVKNRIESALTADVYEAKELASTLDILVNVKRGEQFAENERIENE